MWEVCGSIQKALHARGILGTLMRAATTSGRDCPCVPAHLNERLPLLESLEEVKFMVMLGERALTQVLFLATRASMRSMPSPGRSGLGTTRALLEEFV